MIAPHPFLTIDCISRVTFASAQNAVPILRSLAIENPTEARLSDLTLSLHAQPGFCR